MNAGRRRWHPLRRISTNRALTSSGDHSRLTFPGRKIESIRAALLRRRCNPALNACPAQYPHAHSRFDGHFQNVANRHLGRFSKFGFDDDEEAIPTISDVTVERDAVGGSAYQPSIPARIKTYGLQRPGLLRIER